MNTISANWNALLTEVGLNMEWSDTHIPALPKASIVYCPLISYSLIEVAGLDAITFLQGQLTCDVKRLESQQWLLGAHCTPKGRIISSATIAKAESQTLMRVHNTIADSALAALKKYSVFSKVELSIDTSRLPLAIYFSTPNEHIAQLDFLSEHEATDITALEPGATYESPVGLWLRQNNHTFELWATSDQLKVFFSHRPVEKTEWTQPAYWEYLQIQAGFPAIREETQEEFLPHTLNYDLIDGISFKKGCYTGQEIIARMHYRGKSKKHTHFGLCNNSEYPHTINNAILSGDGKTVGTVVNAVVVEGDTYILAAMNDEALNDPSYIEKCETKIAWQTLPYAIP